MTHLIPPTLENTEEQDLKQDIEDKLIHLLKIYPYLSPSMLQVGLGTSMPSKLWKPVLEELIGRHVIGEENLMMLSTKGRHQTYTRLHLTAEYKKTLDE